MSFRLRWGETVTVMGSNGAGKTTLLDKLSRLLACRRGTVRLDGRDICELRPREIFSRIMFVPQNPEHLFLRESVQDELAIDEQRDHAAILQSFRLEGLLSRSPYSLSEGEKRRLSRACAFLDARDILFLDEPTYGLDYDGFASLVQSIWQLREKGDSLLIVTHSPELAYVVSDSIVMLDHGRNVFAGTPEKFALEGVAVYSLYLLVWKRLLS